MRGRRLELLRATKRGGRATNAARARLANSARLSGYFQHAQCPGGLGRNQGLGGIHLRHVPIASSQE
jgi:hypothetical protein